MSYSESMARFLSDMYNDVKNFYYRSELYKHSQEFSKVLRKPHFTIKDIQRMIPDLTYKKISDWDNKALISSSRSNEDAGWRRFSITDVLKLQIISELRQFGLGIDAVKKIIDRIEHGVVVPKAADSSKGEKIEFLHLEFFYTLCMIGTKVILVLDNYGNVYFVPEAGFFQCPLWFHHTAPPLIILQFFAYAWTVLSELKFKFELNEDTTINFFFNLIPTMRERSLLDLINNKDYRSITITKPDGDKFTIKAKKHERGTFSLEDVAKAITSKDYQKIEVSKVDGKIVTLVREETIKV